MWCSWTLWMRMPRRLHAAGPACLRLCLAAAPAASSAPCRIRPDPSPPRCSDAYLAAQQACSWAQGKAVESFRQRDNGELHVGVMGAGHMGMATIRLLLVRRVAGAMAGCVCAAWHRP